MFLKASILLRVVRMGCNGNVISRAHFEDDVLDSGTIQHKQVKSFPVPNQVDVVKSGTVLAGSCLHRSHLPALREQIDNDIASSIGLGWRPMPGR
jgi:hypothetical protein